MTSVLGFLSEIVTKVTERLLLLEITMHSAGQTNLLSEELLPRVVEEEQHNQKKISVTSLVARVCPFDREAVAATLASPKVYSDTPRVKRKTFSAGNYRDKTAPEILKSWDEAAAQGTRNHEIIEKYLSGSNIATTQTEKRLLESFATYWKEKGSDWTLHRTEWRISSKYGVVGAIDALFKDQNGKYMICEWKFSGDIYFQKKTGKRANVPLHNFTNSKYTAYSLQIYLYKKILEEYGIFTNNMLIVAISPEGQIKEYWPSASLRKCVDQLWQSLKTTDIDRVFPTSTTVPDSDLLANSPTLDTDRRNTPPRSHNANRQLPPQPEEGTTSDEISLDESESSLEQLPYPQSKGCCIIS